jgi:EpsI family protein
MQARIKAGLLLTLFIGIWALSLMIWPPQQVPQTSIELKSMLPTKFATWVRIDNHLLQQDKVISADENPEINRVAEAIYFGKNNQRIMISLSYGENQLDSRFNAHRPEYCYKAQGFTTSSSKDESISIANSSFKVRTLLAEKNGRREQITYWMTMSGQPILPGLSRLIQQVKNGLFGKIPDGYLIRVSSLGGNYEEASASHRAFLNDWLKSLPQNLKIMLIGK